MTISTTLKKFEELKKIILADGKVDENEVEVLLDFVAPYARAGNRDFMELHRLLIVSREDGVISELESEQIIAAIENVSFFLKREQRIEHFLGYIALAGLGLFIGFCISKVIG